MAELQSLRSHLITELRDLLDAEQQLTKVLPDFAARASTPALRMAFEHHLRETEGQIKRLKQAFDVLGEAAQPKRCEGMHGLIREGNTVVSTTPEGALRDAVMITSAQKVEHYEMAAYGTARTYATVLGEREPSRRHTVGREARGYEADRHRRRKSQSEGCRRVAQGWCGIAGTNGSICRTGGRNRRASGEARSGYGRPRTESAHQSQHLEYRRAGYLVRRRSDCSCQSHGGRHCVVGSFASTPRCRYGAIDFASADNIA
jgi:ferritin-like metal-binding protein YciE